MLGAEDGTVGIVVKDDELRTPEKDDLRLGRGAACSRALRRLCGQVSTGPSGAFLPIERAHERAEFSAPARMESVFVPDG